VDKTNKLKAITLTMLISSTIVAAYLLTIKPAVQEPTQLTKHVAYFSGQGHILTEMNFTTFTTSTQLFSISPQNFVSTLTSDAYFNNQQTIYYDTTENILFYNYFNGSNIHVYSSYTRIN